MDVGDGGAGGEEVDVRWWVGVSVHVDDGVVGV